MNNEKRINNFFNKYYPTLLKISKEYSTKYNYKVMDSDEIISEIYLYIQSSPARQEKICNLMVLSAYTSISNYTYNNRAIYYIISIIWNITYRKRSVNGNITRKETDILYVDTLFIDHEMGDVEPLPIHDYIRTSDVLSTAKEIINEKNWYKYQIWYDYYFNEMIYKDVANKYNLSITPIYNIVRDFNKELKTNLIGDWEKKT